MPKMMKIFVVLLIFLAVAPRATTTIGAADPPTKLDVQQSRTTLTAGEAQANDQQQQICRPCACVTLPIPPVATAAAQILPQMVVPPPQAQQQQQPQFLQCPPIPPCPMAIQIPMRVPRPPLPPMPPVFLCPPPQQCPPPPVCPRPEPCPVQAAPAPQEPLPSLPALPAFIAPPPQQQQQQVFLRPPPALVPLIVGTQNDCCCNCVQTTCRATGIAGGRAHGARTSSSLGSAIWEELFGGGGSDAARGPPPPPKLMMTTTEAKCNSRALEQAILENMFTDLESSKRRIQTVAEQKIGAPISVVCGAYEFSFVVYTDLFCQATRHGMSCYAFSSSSSATRK